MIGEQRFKHILEDIGYANAKQHSAGRRWEFWGATYFEPTGPRPESILFLYSDCGPTALKLAIETASQRNEQSNFTIILESASAELEALLKAMQPIPKCNKVLTATDLLYNSIKRTIRETSVSVVDEERYFIEQDVLFGNSNDPVSSVLGLAKWLRGEGDPNKHVAVLLAPAASGKTTLVKQLFAHLIKNHFRHAIPLLVEKSAWERLPRQDSVNLDEIWRAATQVWYPDAIIGMEHLERCLAFGAVCPIFDGFDELCTVFPLELNPDETVRELLSVFNKQNGPGRLLITSRSSFWTENISASIQAEILQIDLRPFSDGQRDAYIQKRFPVEVTKQERTSRILQRIASSTGKFTSRPNPAVSQLGADLQYERIEYIPYVVMLSAESADTESNDIVERYGKHLSSSDPLRGLLLSLCERDIRRHDLKVSAESQISIFATLACEFGEAFTSDDISLVVDSAGENPAFVHQFKLHALVDYRNNQYRFIFPFVTDYLSASALSEWLCGKKDTNSIQSLLRSCALQPGSLLDAAAQLILTANPDNWVDLARMQIVQRKLDDLSQCGLFHLAAVTAKVDSRGSRAESVLKLVKIFGFSDPDRIEDLYLQGSISNFDLSNVSFVNCSFKDVEFTKCTFNERSRFERCKFVGRLLDDSCENFGAIEVVDCELSHAARTAFQSGSVRGINRKVTKEQIVASAYDILRRFTRGPMGFVTRKQDGVRETARRFAPFGADLLDQFVKSRVLEEFITRGTKMYRIAETRDVRLFLQNNLVTGRLQEGINGLAKRLDARPD